MQLSLKVTNAFTKKFSHVEQQDLFNYILMLEAIPYNVLKNDEIQKEIIEIDSAIKNRILLRWNGHYRALTWWLKVLLLAIYKPLPANRFEAFYNVKLEANFSIARLKWSLSIYPEIPLAYENFKSPLELWYMLEFFHFMKWIELTGMTGSPSLNKEGRLLGKAEGMELNIAELNAYKEDFKQLHAGSLLPNDLESTVDSSYEADLTEALLNKALYLVSEAEGDNATLCSACTAFLEAQIKLQRSARKKQHSETHSVLYLVSPNKIFIAQKGVKTPRPNFKPKRPRGRPPKGSNVTKC